MKEGKRMDERREKDRVEDGKGKRRKGRAREPTVRLGNALKVQWNTRGIKNWSYKPQKAAICTKPFQSKVTFS